MNIIFNNNVFTGHYDTKMIIYVIFLILLVYVYFELL